MPTRKQHAPDLMDVSREKITADKMIIFGIGVVQSLPREKQCVSDMQEACRTLRRGCGPIYLATLLHQVQKASNMQIDLFADIVTDDPDQPVPKDVREFASILAAHVDRINRLEKEALQGLAENVIDFQAYKRRRLLQGQWDGTDGAA